MQESVRTEIVESIHHARYIGMIAILFMTRSYKVFLTPAISALLLLFHWESFMTAKPGHPREQRVSGESDGGFSDSNNPAHLEIVPILVLEDDVTLTTSQRQERSCGTQQSQGTYSA